MPNEPIMKTSRLLNAVAVLMLDAGWAWAATAVLAGWWVSRHIRPAAWMLRGALAGGLALGFATISYYGADVLFDGGAWWGVASRFWLIASVLLGPPLGVVGAAIRLPGPAGVVAPLVVLAGAALQMAIPPPPAAGLMAEPVRWSIWIAAVVATVLVERSFRSRSAVVALRAGAERGAVGG